MTELAINQVEYSNDPDGPVIHIFGRDVEGKAHKVDITGFRPYFYAEVNSSSHIRNTENSMVDLDTQYTSILGAQLLRVYLKTPSDVYNIRERYHHFEADIPFTTRFMIDVGLTGGIRTPDSNVVDYHEVSPIVIDAPARVSIIDIECEDHRGFPDPQRDAIICITCYDSFHDDYTTFLLAPEGEDEKISRKFENGGLKNGCFAPGKHGVFSYKYEEELLRDFATFITMTDPDILTGWNFIQFDMPYIFGRMDYFGIDKAMLARVPGYMSLKDVMIRGRALFDLLAAYKKMHQQQKQSYRLDAVAFDEVGERKIRYTGTLTDLWKNDQMSLIEYNFKDVELCVAIEKKNNIVGFYREIARYVGMPLDKTLNSSSVVDTFILHKSLGKYVLPSKGSVEGGEEFEGATVFSPTKGLHENVIVLDLKSLYPMIMMTINASPETKDPRGELVAPNGVRFKKSPDGLVRSIVMELLKERDEKKVLRNKYEFGSREYEMYDMQQSVLKIVMNTYYGVSGYSKFRLYDRDIGAAVTSVGRAILEHSRKVIQEQGFEVILGDTDSCVVKIPPTSREETIKTAKNLEKILNESYDVFARETLHADKHYFSTKFEKMYDRFFSGGKKKRYAGLLTWKEGKDVNEVDIVGFESRRSDTPQITREVQTKVMEMILNGAEYEQIRIYVRGVLKNYISGKYPLDEIGIPGGFSKSLEEYDHADAHVRGAIYSNTHLHTTFGKASKPKRVYIKQVKGKYEKTDVVCFEYGDQIPAEFVIDWETMMEKTLQKPLERIFEALEWDWVDFDPLRTTLSQWGFN